MQIDAVVGVDDGGDGRHKPILDRKIKKTKNAGKKTTDKRGNPDQETGKKDSRAAEQPLGGRTLGTGGAAPERDHGDRSPRGRRGAETRRRRLGQRSCRSDTM